MTMNFYLLHISEIYNGEKYDKAFFLRRKGEIDSTFTRLQE